MRAKLIVMLTKNDRTVADALKVFESVRDLPVEFWGFKDVGLPRKEMEKLLQEMKIAGKKTFLEVVTYSPEACMEGAKLAVGMGFDYLMGTIFYPEIWEYLRDKSIVYLPFVGRVSGSPGVLEGPVDEMIEQSLSLLQMGLAGFDLLAYRYRSGDPEALVREFAGKVHGRNVIAGSIDTPERMRVVESQNVWAFTMGSALFNQKFVPQGSFRENLTQVIKIMDGISPRETVAV